MTYRLAIIPEERNCSYVFYRLSEGGELHATFGPSAIVAKLNIQETPVLHEIIDGNQVMIPSYAFERSFFFHSEGMLVDFFKLTERSSYLKKSLCCSEIKLFTSRKQLPAFLSSLI